MAAYSDKHWWSADELQLHYRDYPADAARASLPPILCLPGLTRNARDFAQLAEHFAGRWRVICPDMRGRGESAYAKDPLSYVPLTYVQDVERLLAEQGITRFISIGTSLGGLMTMLLSAMQPGRIAGAVLNDIGPEIDDAGLLRIRGYVGQGRSFPTWLHAARALQEAHGDVYPRFEISDWLAFAKNSMQLGKGGRIAFDYDMKIAEPFSLPGGEAPPDLWPVLATLADVPAAILRGGNSDILSPAIAARMLSILPKAELTQIADTGHAPTLNEEESIAAIEALLARVEKELNA